MAASRLVRIYSGEGVEVTSSARLDLLIAEGELTALIGAAGSGKSTLVNILAGLDTPTAGTVWVAGHNLGAMTARERLTYRRSVAGFIWQQTSRNLLPYMTARQNVLLPMRLGSVRRRERRRRANFLLDTAAASGPGGTIPWTQVTGDGLVSGSAAAGTTVAELTGPTAEADTRFQLRSDRPSCD